MKLLAIIALLAGCSAANPQIEDIADGGAPECIDTIDAPCCTPRRDLLRDGCPDAWQSLDVGTFSAHCMVDGAYKGPWVEHAEGATRAFGTESEHGITRVQCDAHGRIAWISERATGGVECLSACYDEYCDAKSWCDWVDR